MSSRQLLKDIVKLMPDQEGFSFLVCKEEMVSDPGIMCLPYVYVCRAGSKSPSIKIQLSPFKFFDHDDIPGEFKREDVQRIESIVKDNWLPMLDVFYEVVIEVRGSDWWDSVNKPRGKDDEPLTGAYMEDVEFDDESMYVIFSDGDVVKVPLSVFPELAEATDEAREDFWLSRSATAKRYDGVHWDDLDLDIDLGSILHYGVKIGRA